MKIALDTVLRMLEHTASDADATRLPVEFIDDQGRELSLVGAEIANPGLENEFLWVKLERK